MSEESARPSPGGAEGDEVRSEHGQRESAETGGRGEGQEERVKEEQEEEQEEEEQEEQQEERELQSQSLDEPGLDSERDQLDKAQAHRLSPDLADLADFPDSLFELLCTLQEGRRLNDQRCSFSAPEPRVRRRCHSEPNATKPAPRVVFSSMTSLQKEEFFDLVATAQARRLNDQRARLDRSVPQKQKGRSFRGSLRHLSLRRPEPGPAASPPPGPPPGPPPKEELYSMILHTQAQGRLEDQRSRAPGPMDDEVFFSLLLRVQGGRMDEQRTELPCLLHT